MPGRWFSERLNKSQGHDVDIIHVIEKDITSCRGCFGSWQKLDSYCIIQDDQNAILGLYRHADGIIWSFPLYCDSMMSPLKDVLDCTISLLERNMVQLGDGTMRHEALADFSKLYTLVICGCGFPDWDGNFDGLRKM